MTRNSNDGNLKKVFLNLAPFLALLVIAIFISNSPSITGFFVENGNVTINETINTTDETLSLILNQSLNKTLIESINESLELTINNLTINNITEIIIEEASFSDASSEPVILKTSLIVKDSKQKRVDALITVKDKNNNFIIQTTGLSNTQLTKGKYNIDVDINNKHVKKIEFKGVEVSKNTAGLVKVEDVEPFGKYKKVYSIDPTPSKFTEATVTVTATGTELYKCKDWNFDEQHCYGEWVLFQTGLIPGQEYTFILTPDDPGFAETVSTCSAEDRQALGTFNIACNETNGGYLESDDGVTEAHTYGKSVYAGVRIESVDTSVDFCESIDEVFICYEWWVDVANGQSCDISVDADGGVSYTAASTVCPGITTNPGVTCTNITTLETWTCDSFFNTTGTRALAKSEIDRTPAGADTTETAYWDVLYFNVTYTGAPPLNITQPDDQTVEIGEETTLEWTLSGSGGYYYIERNGTLVEGPKSWVGPEQLIIYEPRTHFLGNWNYTLLYNETGSSTLYDSTVYLNVIDNVTPSCSELGDGSGITSVTVTPDGDLADWQSVLSNPLNYVTDPSALTGDADSVDTADRDMIKFAYTYDETNLYFYFGRLASGSNQIAMLVYLDYDRDGYMNATDDVLNFVWSGSNQLYTSYLYDYVPAVSPGDQMFGDGYNMPGSITNSRILESKVLGGAESGVELETKVLWSDLGLSGITSINFKGAAARGSGGNLPDQLTDNIGELLTPTSTAFLFKPDNEKATTNGTIVYYAHDLMNCGNVQSTIDLYNISSQGWDVKLHYPDSSETEVTDTNGNGIPDITLDVQEYTTLIVEITVPSVVSTGTIDTTNITGQASNYTSTVIDTTTINNIAILPKLYTVSTSQNMNISVNYTIYNYQAISDTINIYSLSSNAWNTYIYYNNSLLTDTNADGFVDTGLLEPLQSKKIELLVEVPVAAVIGTNDSTSIQINSSADPSIFDTSYANSTVYDRLILEPSGYNETVTAGSIHYYEFNITNNWYEPDYINLQYTDTLGWEKTFLDKYYAPLEDSNSDGYADILLEQLGDLEKIFLKVVVPNDAPMGMDEITYIYANSSLDSTVFKTATINNTPRGVALYNDSGRTNLQDVFAIYSTVYAKAFYLQGLSEVYFAWFDGINYVRISPNITVDGSGNADDLIITNSTTYPGVWTIFVYDSSTDAEISRRTFNLTDYVPPSATLISPQPGSIYGYNTTIELAVYASDDILLTELVEAEVVDPEGNITYVFLENAVGDKYNTTFTLGELDGQYNVTFFIRDVAGNLNDSVTTYFIGSDDTPPSMTIHYPGDNAVDVNGNVSFNITSTDDNALQSIELYINGVINQTQSISGIYNETLFEVNELSDGYYNWTIISYDSMNYNQTITRSFLVNTTAAVTINTTTFTGNTTDWNDVPDITNVCDGTAILDAVDDRIRWWDCVDASSIDFDVSVNLTYNLVEIEFGLDDSFNASAEIVMRGLTWDFAPLVYVDGIWCNETCSDVTFDIATGTAIFNVTHFSNYTTVGNSQLEIWDQTDTDKDNLTKYTDSLVAFYANYTTLNKAEPIIGTCTITFNDLIDQPMVYNATSLLYEYNRTFATANIFEYNVTCTGGQTITLTDDVTITSVDTFAPEVNLNYPINYYNTSDTSILFNWTSVDDSTTTMFCNLTIDGLINITDISTINATPTTQIVLGFNDGLHSWNLSCTDDSCNTNTSETRTFTVDTQAPQWSNNLTSPISLVTYSSGQSYEFNVTWTDTGVGLDAVIIEHDFGGTLTNTTIVTSIGSEFYYTYSDLAAGTYTWREYSNDSLNNLNETDAWLYVINKATPVLTLEANPSWSEIYGTQTTVNCTANTLQVTPQLYLDGTLVSNPHQTILGAGIYNYTCNVTTTENYTSAQTSNLMTIAKATSEVNLSLNNVDGDIIANSCDFIDINATLVTPLAGYIEIYNNGTLINAGLSPLNNYTEFNESGSYNITAHYPATENYTESFETHFINVLSDNPPAVDLNYPINYYNTSDTSILFNWTSVDDSTTTMFCNLTIDGLINVTDISTINATPTTQIVLGFNDGLHSWNLSCTDDSCNTNTSETRTFTVDTQAPQWSNNLTSPISLVTYSSGQSYEFNVTWTDTGVGLDAVIIEHDFGGTLTNTTIVTSIGSEFYYTYSDLAAGTYTWREYSNDSLNNLNETDAWLYVINKATPVLTLEANPSWSEIYGTQTTVNCTANTLQVTPQLYLDGTLVSNPHQTILGAGIYNYTCNVTTTENYTSAQTSNLMTIAKATSEVNLSLNNVDGDIVLDLNDFADLNATLVSPIIGYIELYNNGTLINAGLSP
ncbi:MAG: hypothetical protein U9R08_04570, partial [Nanoarchaeota archaeon]|nr:hypothetical protein [Nanoarchaeota archaeon]